MADTEKLVEKILGGVQGYVSRSLAPLLARLKAVGDRPLERGEKGEAGADGASVTAGEGPPLDAGSEGALYIDLKTGDVYRCG